MSLVVLGGREAGREQQLDRAVHVDLGDLVGGDQAALERLPGDPRGIDAATVVADGDDNVAAGVAGGDLEDAGLLLAGRTALVRHLQSVVERVADEVHERIAEHVDDGAVELGVLAGQHQLHLLAELRGQVADEAREAQEDGLDGDHPHPHHQRLQRLGAAGQILHRLAETLDVGVAGKALDGGAIDDQLAHQVHQLVEPLGVDADGGRSLAARLRAVRLRLGGGRSGGRCCGLGRGGVVAHDGASHVGDAENGLLDGAVLVVCGQPRLDDGAIEGLDGLGRGRRADQLAVIAECGEHHVGAHRRHHHAGSQLGSHVRHRDAVKSLGQIDGRRGPGARLGAGGSILVSQQALEADDQRGGIEALGALLGDRLDGAGQRVEAFEQDVDGTPADALGAPAEHLEHVLHLVSQCGNLGKAHRRAHALQRVRGAEDLVERVAVVRGLLDPDHRQVERVEVLAALGQEHAHVLGGVHHALR